MGLIGAKPDVFRVLVLVSPSQGCAELSLCSDLEIGRADARARPWRDRAQAFVFFTVRLQAFQHVFIGAASDALAPQPGVFDDFKGCLDGRLAASRGPKLEAIEGSLEILFEAIQKIVGLGVLAAHVLKAKQRVRDEIRHACAGSSAGDSRDGIHGVSEDSRLPVAWSPA